MLMRSMSIEETYFVSDSPWGHLQERAREAYKNSPFGLFLYIQDILMLLLIPSCSFVNLNVYIFVDLICFIVCNTSLEMSECYAN